MGMPKFPPQNRLNRLKGLKQRLLLSLDIFAPVWGTSLGWSY